ncbi:hypothetical protein KRX57_06465 [Weeksellaceae bacterium TAE3-ERU29]|nr:hypothetical protein [Weeksellaceae bacterium TAE3-ERU29]
MVKKVSLSFIFLLLLVASCEKDFYQLSMDRVPYSGTELKTNGCYYSNLRSDGRNINVAIFYRNGFCIHSTMDITRSEFEVKSKQDTLKYVKAFLEDKEVFKRFLNEPTSIGVFRIEGKDIEFETWENGYDVLTFSNYGKILNDSTFFINKFVQNQRGRKEYTVNLTYKFVEYSPKPDSISSFIK